MVCLRQGVYCISLVFAFSVSLAGFSGAKKAPLKFKSQSIQSKALADWSIVVYMQADNNLAPFATYNINNMQQVSYVPGVNMLVQWDQPNNNKTWRYKIVNGGRIDAGSLSVEMGTNPVQELIGMMRWVKNNYEARHYAAILWNHGNGIVDPRSLRLHPLRGILFDDAQNTYLNNQALATSFAAVKSDVLGKNIDLVGMDACLMAMLEVGYQIKDSVDVLVGSQNTEPGQGWSYAGFLNPLCANATSYDAKALGRAIVNAYGKFYRQGTGIRDYTQSAIDLNKINAAKLGVDDFLAAVTACAAQDGATTKGIIKAARAAVIDFYNEGYIDMGMFYNAVIKNIKSKKNGKGLNGKKLTPLFVRALDTLIAAATAGLQTVNDVVIANVVGSQVSAACGLSIYYPKGGNVDRSYPKTLFAQSTNWVKFIKAYK